MDDVLHLVALAGLISVGVRCTLNHIQWWNQRDSSTGLGKKYPSGGLPVKALGTFYQDGSSDIQASAARLLKKFYLSSKNNEIIGLVRLNLSSAQVGLRMEAITVLRGLIADELPSYVQRVCDNDTVAHFMSGLFESINSTQRSSDDEIVYRKVAFGFINYLGRVPETDPETEFIAAGQLEEVSLLYCFKFLEHGLFDFFVQYDRIARIDPHLHKLDRMMDPCDVAYEPNIAHCLYNALDANSQCGLGLIPYDQLRQSRWATMGVYNARDNLR
uniref:ARAD1C14872p n=1 Tax=Blastobotrys adeninivorans TaxID=409370 RepID=A0A060T6L3_BLAAD